MRDAKKDHDWDWLGLYLFRDDGTYTKEASQGLAAAINCARRNNLVDPIILDKADRLRLIRNPFVHLKEFDNKHGLGQRMAASRNFDFRALLEKDAQEALIAMYGVAAHAFGH